jgi:hypothetical protein
LRKEKVEVVVVVVRARGEEEMILTKIFFISTCSTFFSVLARLFHLAEPFMLFYEKMI